MNLSEAMRLGSMEGPQGFWSNSVTSGDARCALGCAAWAGGVVKSTSLETYVALSARWPILRERVTPPADSSLGVSDEWILLDVIWRLNDVAKWTRERIADWVATIEQQEPQAPQPEPATVTAKV